MNNTTELFAWLFFHKAAMEPNSPLNLDGSEYMVGVAIVPAADIKTAISCFEAHLEKKKMSTLDIYKVERWSSDNYTDSSFASEEINLTSQQVINSNTIYYVLGESSESLNFDEESG